MSRICVPIAISLLFLPLNAIAQDQTELPEIGDDGGQTEMAQEEAQEPVDPPEPVLPQQEPEELLSSWVTGTQVMSTTMEPIGGIRDLLINEEDGSITGAVLSVGGFLGMGAKAIAVDWNELNFDYDANEITIDLTREEADIAPEYEFRERTSPPPAQPATDTGGQIQTDPGL